MIYTSYNRPPVLYLNAPEHSDTVQGIVTSLSALLNGMDDNNMKVRDLSYSGDAVVDLYPEVFGRPTKYELEYYAQENGSTDVPEPSPSSDSVSSSPDVAEDSTDSTS